jgi:hypothetical protein
VWFKVQESGRTGTSNVWGATALMSAGGSVTYTVPKCIKDGYYLVRHEIIALHSAYTYPGAQFYPVRCNAYFSCIFAGIERVVLMVSRDVIRSKSLEAEVWYQRGLWRFRVRIRRVIPGLRWMRIKVCDTNASA